jgi:hypothetical protein
MVTHFPIVMKQHSIAIMSKCDVQLSPVNDAICFSQWDATVFDPGTEMSEDKVLSATRKCGPNSACGSRMQVFCSVVLGVFEEGCLMDQDIYAIQGDDSWRLFRCIA